jgi:hypothetical protein
MVRRLVWLIPFLIVAVTCALNDEGSGNVIPQVDGGGDAHATGGGSGVPEGGVVLPDVVPADAIVGH